MKVFVLNKTTVEVLNEMNQKNHKLPIIELKDGSFVTPFKVLNELNFKKYKKYLEKCSTININKSDLFKTVIDK